MSAAAPPSSRPATRRQHGWVAVMALGLFAVLSDEASAARGGLSQATLGVAPAIGEMTLSRTSPAVEQASSGALAVALAHIKSGEHDAARVLLVDLVARCPVPGDPAVDCAAPAGDVATAHYWLGWLDEEQGNLADAQRHYEHAADQYVDLGVQAAADDAVLRLLVVSTEQLASDRARPRVGVIGSDRDAHLIQPLPTDRFLFASGKAKHIDGLADPADADVLPATDQSLEMLVAGMATLWRTGHTRLKVQGTLYRDDFDTFSDYDLQVGSASLIGQRWLGDHRLELRLGLRQTWLGDERYLGQVDAELADAWALGDLLVLDSAFRWTRSGSDTSAYSAFAGTGWRARLQLRDVGGRWHVAYQRSRDDRADTDRVYINANGLALDGFRSYSKGSDALSVDWEQPWTARWRQRLSIGLRRTRYLDPDRYLASPEDKRLVEQTRQSRRLQLGTEVAFALSDRLTATGEVEFQRAFANAPAFEYATWQFALGLQWAH